MGKKSVGVNAVLNLIKQLCAIIFPLITFPYISRVLQTENFGKINFSHSIVSYFILIAALGINNYAIREGARIRDDKKKFQSFSEQVFTINAISTIVSYCMLFLLVIFWGKLHAYWNIILIHSLSIVLATIGADWVNSIYEDYLYITIRYITMQCVSLALMFLLVKKPEDYVIYAGITVLSNAGANVANILHVRKYTHLRIIRKPNIRTHIKPMLMLFCNSLSVQIYVNSDITMLGIFRGDTDVGIYSASVKIYNIIKQLLNAVVVVTIPRISSLLGAGKRDEYNRLLDQTFHSLMTLILPAITGIFVLSYEIVYIIGGDAYAQGHWALRVLSIALMGAVFGNFFNNSVLVPNKKEKNFLTATLTAAIVNAGLNLIMIPWIGYVGAAVTTVIAEIVVLLFGIYYAKGLFEFRIDIKDTVSCITGCLLIAVSCFVIKTCITGMLVRTLLSIAVAIIIYAGTLIVFKNRLAIIAINTVKKKMRTS